MSGWGIKDQKTKQGTLTIASNGTVTGSNTLFTTQCVIGNFLSVDLTSGGATAGEIVEWVITAIASNTSMTVVPANPGMAAVYTAAYADFTTFGGQTIWQLSEKPKSLAYGDGTNIKSTQVFGVDATEMTVTPGPAHAGWVKREVVGTRTRYETLVALSKNAAADMGDAEDTAFPDSTTTTTTAAPTTTTTTTAAPTTTPTAAPTTTTTAAP